MENKFQEKFAYPIQRTKGKVRAYMAPWIQDFIRHSPFCVMATSNAEGDCDASPKGGIPGFVKVLNDIAFSFSGISAYLALKLVSQCHSEEPFGHAQDKLRDEESVVVL